MNTKLWKWLYFYYRLEDSGPFVFVCYQSLYGMCPLKLWIILNYSTWYFLSVNCGKVNNKIVFMIFSGFWKIKMYWELYIRDIIKHWRPLLVSEVTWLLILLVNLSIKLNITLRTVCSQWWKKLHNGSLF